MFHISFGASNFIKHRTQDELLCKYMSDIEKEYQISTGLQDYGLGLGVRATQMEGSFGTRKSITPCAGSRPERRKQRSCTSSSASTQRTQSTRRRLAELKETKAAKETSETELRWSPPKRTPNLLSAKSANSLLWSAVIPAKSN